MTRRFGQVCGRCARGLVAFAIVLGMTACGGVDGVGILSLDAGEDVTAPDGFVATPDGPSHHDGDTHHDGGHPDAKTHPDGTVKEPDSGRDSGVDAGHDAGHDTGTDGAPDSAVDSATDGGKDGSHDSSADSGAPDVGVDAPVNQCMDGIKDGNETDIDCGGGTCPPCPVGDTCNVNADCKAGDGCNAMSKLCAVGLCTDGIKDGTETGVDCGGTSCPRCPVGQGCLTNTDCITGEGCDILTKTCDANECDDGIKDGNETDVDCGGGTCPGCGVGKACTTDDDCAAGAGCDVTTKTCDDNLCNDGIKDGNETGVDCGGGTCPACNEGQGCKVDSDCVAGEGCDVTTKTCDDNLCHDGIKDGNETDIDCGGGTCPSCAVGKDCKVDSDCVTGDGCDVTTKTCDANECHDGIKDGTETDIDCGGATCPGCVVGKDCNVDSDCASPGGCDVTTHKCDANECHDGLQDGTESDVDCGGTTCPGCPVGDTCNTTSDCTTGEGCDQTTKTCDANTCHDGVKDGTETGVDCGGGTCATCPVGQGCASGADCASDYCYMGTCANVCTNTTYAATGAQQQLAITVTGSYTITAAGSQGGASGYGGAGGDAATASATFALTAGNTLQIVVGTRTASTGGSNGGGGGGGTFVYVSPTAAPLPAQPLLVAGGGGGGSGSGGLVTAGGGGGGAAGGGIGPGGGGTGWTGTGGSNGANGGGHWGGGSGNSFGGNTGSAGGFGGGGGANVDNSTAGGGGGGYTGGTGGGSNGTSSVGGTSYVAGGATSVMQVGAAHTGEGSVVVTGPLSPSCP
jgi:hypothetical protein